MRQRPYVLVPFAMAAALWLGACVDDPSPTTDHELSGYVIDETTRAPISGATVTFSSDTLYTASTTTDDDGLYEMVVETDTDFGQVRVEKAGYFTTEMTVYFDVDMRRVDFELRAQ